MDQITTLPLNVYSYHASVKKKKKKKVPSQPQEALGVGRRMSAEEDEAKILTRCCISCWQMNSCCMASVQLWGEKIKKYLLQQDVALSLTKELGHNCGNILYSKKVEKRKDSPWDIMRFIKCLALYRQILLLPNHLVHWTYLLTAKILFSWLTWIKLRLYLWHCDIHDLR